MLKTDPRSDHKATTIWEGKEIHSLKGPYVTDSASGGPRSRGEPFQACPWGVWPSEAPSPLAAEAGPPALAGSGPAFAGEEALTVSSSGLTPPPH